MDTVTVTFDAARWGEIADALASGRVALSTGHQQRTAGLLAFAIRDETEGQEGDVTLRLAWDDALSVAQANEALLGVAS